MRAVRNVPGFVLWDKEGSDEIRQQRGMRSWDKRIHERKKNWLEHLQRAPSESSKTTFILSTDRKM
jgi:hypothetical protein